MAEDKGKEETRAVEVSDPGLSGEANRRLTEELREVVGEDSVRVPADRPRPSRGHDVPRQGVAEAIGSHRAVLIGTFMGFLTLGAIISLSTGSWWFLPLAAGVHALGTMTVMAIVVRMTTITEKPSPETEAMLEEEGVSNPEEHFSDIVEEFTAAPQVAEEVRPDGSERTVSAGQDPSAAAGEQRSAMSPSAGPSTPTGRRAVPAAVQWSVVVVLALLGIVLPAAFGGGWLWVLTAVIVPCALAWIIVRRLLASSGPDAAEALRGKIPLIVVGTAVAVAGFAGIVALIYKG